MPERRFPRLEATWALGQHFRARDSAGSNAENSDEQKLDDALG
jgi:hypothetical protein